MSLPFQRGPHSGTDVCRTAEMRARAFKLRLQRKTLQQIADELGIGRTRAFALIKEAIDELKEETVEDSETWRILLTREHQQRLEKLQNLLDDPDPKVALDAHRVSLLVTDKLQSLWVRPMAVRAELSGPNGAPLQSVNAGLDLAKLPTEQLEQVLALLSGQGQVAPAVPALPAE